MKFDGHSVTSKSLQHLRSLLEGKVITFRWANSLLSGLVDEVVNEPAKVIRCRVWYQHEPAFEGHGPPEDHIAALAPALMDMTDIEVHHGSVTCGSYVIYPKA